MKTFFDLDQSGVEFVFSLNYMGTLLPTKEFAKDMVNRQGCSILNISSMNAFTPLTKIPAYSGAKAAVSNFTQWLAVHFSKVGIRCNAICPGSVLTPMTTGTSSNLDPDMYGAMENYGNLNVGICKPEDIANVALFLASDESSAITGQELVVDKGYSL